MRWMILLVCATLLINRCPAQGLPPGAIAEFKRSDLSGIQRAKDLMMTQQELAIPVLVAMLSDTHVVKLTNTADLIYPGATKYYGHGRVIDYDIDWIGVRAAWVLEEMCFMDFGFRDTGITEDSLMALHMAKYQTEYRAQGFHTVDFRSKTPRERLLGAWFEQ